MKTKNLTTKDCKVSYLQCVQQDRVVKKQKIENIFNEYAYKTKFCSKISFKRRKIK
jgi:hypothetical protein